MGLLMRMVGSSGRTRLLCGVEVMSARVRFTTIAAGLVAAALAGAALSSATVKASSAPLKAAFGAWGMDLDGGDRAVRPGVDFYRYANGRWIDRTEIPADKSNTGVASDVNDATTRQVRTLLDTAAAVASAQPRGTTGKVGAFYASYLDAEHVETLGLRPMQSELAAIRAATTYEALADIMGRSNTHFAGTLLRLGVDVDRADPRRYAVQLSQDGLGLPDRAYYLDPKLSTARTAYAAYVRRLLEAAGWPDAEREAANIIGLETRIAEASWTRTQQRDWRATYNPTKVAALQASVPGFPWKRFLAAAGLGETRDLIVAERDAVPRIAAIFVHTPVVTLQAWLAFTALDHGGPYLSSTVLDPYTNFRYKALGGQTAAPPRAALAVRAVSGGPYLGGDRYDRWGNMGWAVGELYLARYFPSESRRQLAALVEDLRAAYRVRLEHATWLAAPTRAEALRKLARYQLKIGGPVHPRDYSSLVIRRDDLVGNVRRTAAADWAFQLGKLHRPVDDTEWAATPQSVLAYQGPWLREVAFAAGILQPPFFDPAADPAVNYGGIGMIIAHEMTHGFDDQGRQFDADGRLRDWWTPADAAEFDKRAGRLADQFSRYEALPGGFVQGRLVLGEAMGDWLGLSIALDAYHRGPGRNAPVIDGLTGDQRFFLGFAQAFRSKSREGALRQQLLADPHPPRTFRVNGSVRNIDGWYDAFGVEPGDALYLAPRDRVVLW